VLIPSIDLMGGRIVQLVQGEKKALEFGNFAEWVSRFAKYPLVQLIDLDAAMGKGDNRALIGDFCGQLPCQVGGGIRTANDAQRVFDAGAKRVILGSSLVNDGIVDTTFASAVSGQFGVHRLVAAIDSRGGRVAIHGWKTITQITPAEMMAALEPYCSAFLYTHIDTEGMLQGIPIDVVRDLKARTSRKLIAAGGIRSQQEIDVLDAIGVDAVVGMAIYTGAIKV
jgi:phosphoribosylformimino-5-aminoimidazole carboxamide ribotide isomerase